MFKSCLLLILLSFSLKVYADFTPRKIMAFWDSSEHAYPNETDYTASNIHRKLEVIFNHYGYILTFQDVNQKDTSFLRKDLSSEYVGAITWFADEKMRHPKKFASWLSRQFLKNKKVMILGYVGFLNDLNDKAIGLGEVNRYLRPMQLRLVDGFYSNPYIFKLNKSVDPSWLGFEARLENEIKSVNEVQYFGNKSHIWADIKITSGNKKIPTVIVSDQFVYLQNEFVTKFNEEKFLTKWKINPFKMVEHFVDINFPIPDTTTRYGRRILYNHIDGDGFINISYIDRESYSGDIIINKILKKYRYPTTVSIIIAEIDKKYLGNERTEESIKKMYKLPHVEAASHTYTHPLSWNKTPTKSELITYGKPANFKKPILGYNVGYKKLDFNLEIHQSIKAVNEKYVPREKRTNLLLWSGSCHPPIEAFKVLDKYKYINLNGGDPIFTNSHPSYSHLSPHLRKINNHTQVYSSAANENIYTNLWEGPYGGYAKLIEYLKNTEEPIRIKPMNVYYHFYSGERKAALIALEQIYEWIGEQKTNPIYTTEFAKIMLDYEDIKIQKISKNHFKISGLKHLKTLRLETSSLVPDYAKSKNIIGHKTINGKTYIHIGKDENASLVLNGNKNSKLPYLISSNSTVHSIQNLKDKIIINYTTHGEFDYEINNPKNKTVKLVETKSPRGTL